MAETQEAVPSLIAQELRSRIACGVLGHGARLGQTELAQQFRASRVPVREALKLLSAEGLVEHDPNRGFFVAKFSSHEAKQLFRLRELVEQELLATIEWPTPAQVKQFAQRANELERLLDEGKRSEWQMAHRQFHEDVFDLSPNKVFVREAMRLWALTDRYRALLPLPRRSSEERAVVMQAEIVAALKERNLRQVQRVRADRRRAFENQVLETLADRGL